VGVLVGYCCESHATHDGVVPAWSRSADSNEAGAEQCVPITPIGKAGESCCMPSPIPLIRLLRLHLFCLTAKTHRTVLQCQLGCCPVLVAGHDSEAWEQIGPYMRKYGRHAIANSQLFNPEYIHFYVPGVGSVPYILMDL